jgi:INO80 complex subunit C
MSQKRATPSDVNQGRLTEFDPDDWFVPLDLPFKIKHHSAGKKQRPWKRLKHIIAAEHYQQLPADQPTYVNIEAPPSIYPAKKYCDLTGYEAPYVDPKTKLRYASADLFPSIRSLPQDVVQQYLAMRHAHTVLK